MPPSVRSRGAWRPGCSSRRLAWNAYRVRRTRVSQCSNRRDGDRLSLSPLTDHTPHESLVRRRGCRVLISSEAGSHAQKNRKAARYVARARCRLLLRGGGGTGSSEGASAVSADPSTLIGAAQTSSPAADPSQSLAGQSSNGTTTPPQSRAFFPPGSTPIAAGRTVAGVTPTTTTDLSTLPAVMPDGMEPGGTACTAQKVTNHGTPSLTAPKISVIYWGNQTAGWLDDYLSVMANTPAFYSRLREYAPSGHTIAGSWNTSYLYPSGATGSVTDATFVAGIQAAIGSYVPSANDIFVILIPSGTSSSVDINNKGGPLTGHHASYVSGGVTIPWAVVEPGNRTSTELRTSHEVIEAITDPNALGGTAGTGWWTEIGDPCSNSVGKVAGKTVQPFWSQKACRCVIEEDLSNLDVAANGYFGYTVYEQTNYYWYSDGAPYLWAYGAPSAFPYAGDYNGDGRSEFAYFTPYSSPPQQVVFDIITGVTTTYNFGAPADSPLTGDFDNPQDGKSDLAVWNATQGFRVISSVTGNTVTTSWGIAGDIPVPADFDGDGTTDYAVVRPSNGTWYVIGSKTGSSWSYSWTLTSGDIPVAGDFNGDGLADYAYFRPSNSTWYVAYNVVNYAYSMPWGINGDIPLGRDVDGDWATDLTVYRPSNSTFYTIESSTWTQKNVQWAPVGAPVPVGQPNGSL